MKRVQRAVVGVTQGVEVLLGGLDLGVTHPLHDRGKVRAAGQKPGGVSVPQVVHPDREVDTRCLDGGEPDPGAEGVPRDWRTGAGGEEQVVVSDVVGLDVLGDGVEPGLTDAKGAGFVSFG